MEVKATGGVTAGVAPQANPLTPARDDFFQLLVTQLRYQDPMQPMQDKDFVAQLAQFSSLEELQALRRTQALLLLGRTVTVEDREGGERFTGPVDRLVFRGSTMLASVCGRMVALEDVVEVGTGAEA